MDAAHLGRNQELPEQLSLQPKLVLSAVRILPV